MRIFRGVAVYVLIGASLACGNSSTPTTPTPVAPNIAGQWTGAYTTTACTETGSAIGGGFCAAVGSRGGLTFTPSQAQGSVTGTLGIGAFAIPVTGNLDPRGVLSLSGVATIAQGFQLTINTWQATISGNTMTGTMAYTVLNNAPPLGSATVSATTSLTR